MAWDCLRVVIRKAPRFLPGDHLALEAALVPDDDARPVRVHLAVVVLVPRVRVLTAFLEVFASASQHDMA